MAKITATDIREQVKAKGLEGFVNGVMKPALEGRKLDNGGNYKLKPEDFSIRAIFEACSDRPFSEAWSIYKGIMSEGSEVFPVREGIDSTMFPTLTGQLVLNKLIEGYNKEGFIGDQLVDTVSATSATDTIPGLTYPEGAEVVNQGEQYPKASFGEKTVTATTEKRGLMVQITEEDVVFDRTGWILRQAQSHGETVRETKERVIIDGIMDVNSNVYRPSGTATALYAGGNNNLLASTPLTDWADIDAAFQYHVQNVTDDRHKGTKQPIMWMPDVVLTPRTLMMKSRNIFNATEIRSTNGNELTNTQNPISGMGMRPLSSPYMDGTSTSTWYIGNFKKQFIWSEVWPLQTIRLNPSDAMLQERDIAAAFKVRYYGNIAALDTRHVIKVTA